MAIDDRPEGTEDPRAREQVPRQPCAGDANTSAIGSEGEDLEPGEEGPGSDEKKQGARYAAGRPAHEPCSHAKTDGEHTIVQENQDDYKKPPKIIVTIGRVTGLLIASTSFVGALVRFAEEVSKIF
ncbi:hypothetical protein [Winogradskya humida]|uniref:Uncharacterized protein n=1 Tax=Winogradskya humida TaxID=113566 RepID=A0ABQ3ZUB0_9ACTN|nr:hypothetical protein [Actinoplanes humidus]GIE22139.1 hypothetical protein Ahu01nite_052410 [Actinoplanes humidus]